MPEENIPSSGSLYTSPEKKTADKSKGLQPSIILKVLIIFVITLVLQIPLMMVNGLVNERQYRQDDVNQEISNSWATEQLVAGPLLAVPVKSKNTKVAFVFPEDLKVDGKIEPQERYRGIFKTTVYSSKLNLKGSFAPINFNNLSVDKSQLDLSKAKLLIAIKDVRGVTKVSAVNWGGQSISLQPGIPLGNFTQSGLYAPVSVSDSKKATFDLNLDLNGSREIKFIPGGKQTDVTLASNWSSPSFIGGYLPVKRDVSEKGFNATWQISPFARSFQNQWLDTSNVTVTSLENSALGASLLSPVDHYRQSDRAVKYGILFLTLTFVTYFLFEMLTKSWLNPFHYILVGVALCLFYLLLLSFSEVIGFMWAYVISSVATVGLIGWFTKGIIKKDTSSKLAIIVSGLLLALYIYLYVLLQLEDWSLLFGSIGLFVVLFIIMLVTRKIDWNNQSVES